MHFAKRTPYETILEFGNVKGEQVIAPEIADVVKSALISVVEEGTAKRLNKTFVKANGTKIPVGGKTGTGDNRRDIYGARGRLIESKVISRTGTFVFLIGDRFFGTITTYVEGPRAAQHKFTSTLPVQVLKVLAPKLMPLIEEKKKIAPVPAVLKPKPSVASSLKTGAKTTINKPKAIINVDQPSRKEPEDAKKPQLSKMEQTETKRFTIKLGTFSSRQNAENLISSLRSSGYSPKIRTETVGDQEFFHISVGNFEDADKAREFGDSLHGKVPNIDSYMIKELPK